MIQMTLQVAEAAVRAAQDKAAALRSPMTVTVVDEAGRLVLSARGDGTGFFTPETSRAKAVASAAFKKRTAELNDLVGKGGFWSSISQPSDHQLELRGLLDRQVGGLGPFEDLVDVGGGAPREIGNAHTVGHEPPGRARST